MSTTALEEKIEEEIRRIMFNAYNEGYRSGKGEGMMADYFDELQRAKDNFREIIASEGVDL